MRIFTLISAILCIGNLFSQSNSVKVAKIISPVENFNYNVNDTFDIVARVKNEGSNIINASDSLHFTISVASNDTTYEINLKKHVGADLPVNFNREYTLVQDFVIDSSNNYSICAGIDRTDLYPDNPNKFPSSCAPFVVGLSNQALKVEKLFYADHSITIQPNRFLKANLSVHDITGKTLKKQSVAFSGSFKVSFKPPAKGFYFLRIREESGSVNTFKFVVH